MPTPAEHRALLFFAAVAALGIGVRGVAALRRDRVPESDRAALAAQIAVVDSAVTAGGRRRVRASAAQTEAKARARRERVPPAAPAAPRGSPPAPLAPIDMDVASAAEIERLPGIGPALATRIVTDRDSLGAFGSLTGLQRVRGIGPALARRLEGRVTFSRPPRQ